MSLAQMPPACNEGQVTVEQVWEAYRGGWDGWRHSIRSPEALYGAGHPARAATLPNLVHCVRTQVASCVTISHHHPKALQVPYFPGVDIYLCILRRADACSGPGWRGAVWILSTMPTVDWVLLGSGKLEKGSIYMQIVCRRTLPLSRKSM